MNRWVFEGVEYATRGEMCAARPTKARSARSWNARHDSRSSCTRPTGHDAEHVQQAVIRKMQYLLKLPRNSLTWD